MHILRHAEVYFLFSTLPQNYSPDLVSVFTVYIPVQLSVCDQRQHLNTSIIAIITIATMAVFTQQMSQCMYICTYGY